MDVTRRRFNKALLAAGLLQAMGAQGAGIGPRVDRPGRRPVPRERKTFHFHLPELHPYGEHFLHVGGQRYRLQAHTALTRQHARRKQRGLAHLNDEHLSHFVENVWVVRRGVQRMHVTTLDPERGPGLALVAMHIDTHARRGARRERGWRGLQSSMGVDCAIQDQIEDDYLTARSAAKAIITHHPDLCSLDADTAAAIEAHMDGDQAAAVDNLALSICAQGPAYEHDPAYLDGWCVLVPMTNDDGTPQLDPDGEQIYDYQFSEQTGIDMAPAIEALLGAVKNDPSLDGQQYQVIYHGDPVDEAALPPASPPVLGDEDAMLAALAPGFGATSGENVALGTTGYHHNVLFYDLNRGADGRSFNLKVLNLNFIWYGLYVEYLDGVGEPLSTENRSSWLNELVASGLDVETDTLKFWDLVSPPPTVFGLPTPFPYQITLSLPEGAAAVRLSLIGPGAMGKVSHGPSLIPGIVLTAMLGYAVPIYYLSKGVGEIGNKGLIELFKQPGIVIKTLTVLSQAYSAQSGTNTNDLGFAGSVESFFAAFIQDILLQTQAIPELYEYLVADLGEAEAAESVPFVGWVVRIMALLGTAADMATTTGEIATNPATIRNTVSFTHPVTVVIRHDPDDFEFPLTATHYEVWITVSGKALSMPPVPISDQERANDSLSVGFPPVPSTGAPAALQVIFYTATGYPIAHSAAVDSDGNPVLDETGNPVPGEVVFTNTVPPSGLLVVDVTIVENPFPVDAQTRYVHHHKLEYANSQYRWNYTASPPALEPANCGASSGLCELGNVSVWVPGGMIGYSWRAASPTVHDCRTGAAGQLYTFQNLSLRNDPNPARKNPGCGFPGAAPVAYDATVRVGQNGHHFYLDPVNISDLDPVYHLRRIVLDNTTPITVDTNQSWGRFRIPIDRLAVYGKGDTPMVVGISTRHHKFAVLEIPSVPYLGEDFGNNAKVMSGPGESNDGLILNPDALTLADNGAILILQGGALKSVKAFDFDGKPWKFFNQGTSSVLSLATDAGSVTWLDISIDPTNLLYVLSHAGAGTQSSDYRLDVYDATTGEHVVRNTGIAVGRIVVDKFRGLYSLNYETVKGSPIVEPSVSVWEPTAQ